MQRYEKYKDSRIDWLGKIPVNWETEKGKWLFIKNERPVLADYDVITCFRDGEVTLRKNRREDGFTNSLKEIGYQGVLKGDLVIHQMDAFAGAIGVSDSDGKSTPVYSVCSPRVSNVSNYFYAYYLRSMALAGVISSLAKGIRERSTDFRFNDFSNLIYPLPPISEQEAIAKFLDDKCEKIDSAIHFKEQQIEKLKEFRQITIHNAVTKGVRHSKGEVVQMKDSGIEWIGKVPEDWEVKRLKYTCLINQKSLSETTDKNQELDYVDIGSVSLTHGIEKTESYLFGNSPSRARRIASVNDTIISTVRTYLKAIDFIDESKSKFIFSTGFAILTPNGVSPKYLANVVRSNVFTDQVSFASKGMSYPAINSTDLGCLWIPIPPVSEQKAIITHLQEQTSKIDKAISQRQEQIVKLKEYKQSLINEVVTGKIKVTG
ncbi:restriction endonuclease subunit S [Sphingobacterium multivorum]|uniref:EcoKI restriction-modification system protein HsdS n=1 Tax=Sphingobacterium multivorum TaxID=28454 RepID=A0A2X2INF5_SPHMU|nr:restriction endonuclease subunit S [Sphingobacterium multivorum]QRQ59804.1 restriction endonuclease subunit S [Sphingobacterium multivorum]SPZ83578.1 EcoKI restriction-modification system protein HsdS [Sphingobacterium multivorum]